MSGIHLAGVGMEMGGLLCLTFVSSQAGSSLPFAWFVTEPGGVEIKVRTPVQARKSEKPR